MNNFFQRQKSAMYKEKFVPYIKKELNLDNVDDIKKSKVLSLYEPKYEKDFLAYRFDLLKQWMDKNKNYSKEYVVALDEMVDKLYLFNELNSFEQQYIKNVQAIVFAKNRNLKQLIVDFPVNKNEFVFYRYDLDAFKLVDKKGLVQIIKTPEMYITTERLIISKKIDIISIDYKIIENYQYSRSKFSLTLKNGRKCFIDSENNRAIVESWKRVLAREKIEFK